MVEPRAKSTSRAGGAALAVACALVLTEANARGQTLPEPPPATPAGSSEASPEAQPAPPVAALPAPAGALDRADDTHWRPKRELHFGTVDFVVTGIATGVVVGTAVASPHSRHWRGGIGFDEDVRDALRAGSLRGRYWLRDLSDVGVSLASTWPFLFDALVTAWWHRGRADLARNMALVSAEAFALAAAVQGVANVAASRERPFGRLCGTEIPNESVDCDPGVRYRSFFSGHATLAFTSAGLLCANHLGLGLLGSPGDILTCTGGFTVAAMTGLFRVMSDMHYASDAGIGALVGTTVGLAVPLLHFRRSSTEPSAGTIEWRLAPVGRGVGIAGTF